MELTRNAALRGIAALTAAVGVPAAAAVGVPAAARAQAATHLVVGPLASPDMSTLYYAQQQGDFAREGLDVEIQPMASGAAAMAAAVGGSLQVGYANTLSLCQAHARGVGVQLIFPGGLYRSAVPVARLVIASGSSISEAKDFVDKTIAVTSLHDLTTLALRAWLAKGGVAGSRVNFIEIPPAAMYVALSSGRVAGIALFDPFLSAAVAQGAKVVADPYNAIAPSFLSTAWFTLAPWSNDHRDAVLKFVGVMRRTAPYTQEHYNDLIPMISGFSKLAPEALAHMPPPYVPTSFRNAPLQQVIDVAARFQEISAAFPARDLILPGLD